jgi:hypothetical protein
VDVHIGTIEVVVEPPRSPAGPSRPRPEGFERYTRLRTFEWDD